MRPIVLNNDIKFGDPRSNRSQEISPKAIICGISTVFRDNVQLEIVSDVISGVSVEKVSMDVCVKFVLILG